MAAPFKCFVLIASGSTGAYFPFHLVSCFRKFTELSADTAQNYIRYNDGLEEIDTDEQGTFQKISDLMSKGADNVR